MAAEVAPPPQQPAKPPMSEGEIASNAQEMAIKIDGLAEPLEEKSKSRLARIADHFKRNKNRYIVFLVGLLLATALALILFYASPLLPVIAGFISLTVVPGFLAGVLPGLTVPILTALSVGLATLGATLVLAGAGFAIKNFFVRRAEKLAANLIILEDFKPPQTSKEQALEMEAIKQQPAIPSGKAPEVEVTSETPLPGDWKKYTVLLSRDVGKFYYASEKLNCSVWTIKDVETAQSAHEAQVTGKSAAATAKSPSIPVIHEPRLSISLHGTPGEVAQKVTVPNDTKAAAAEAFLAKQPAALAESKTADKLAPTVRTPEVTAGKTQQPTQGTEAPAVSHGKP